MRILVRSIAVLMVVAACGGGSAADSSSTTRAVSTTLRETSTTNPGSTTVVEAASTTTQAPPATIGAELLVSGPDGVYLVGAEGAPELIISGAVAYAVDDLEGGVLFQRERWTQSRRSIVYRVRADSNEPVETLVAQSGQGLALNGIAVDGDTYIYYSRREGSTIEDSRETLRRYSLQTREVEELRETGGWEAGSFPISVSDHLILINWSAEIYHGMDFADLRANQAAVAADPTPEGGYEDCAECPSFGALAADGTQLVFLQTTADGSKYAVIKHVASGAEIRRLNLDSGGVEWWVASFDLVGSHLVVNRTLTSRGGELGNAWLYDLSLVDPEPIVLGVSGEAYLTRSPVSINGPVPAP